MKVQQIYTNKIFKKSLKFAADNSLLFGATTSFVLSTVARPIAIMSTPKTDKENKKYACVRSFASSAAGYLMMLLVSKPFANAVKKIDENPAEYLSKKTIKTLKDSEKSLTSSSKYKFATQLFKLGLGFLVVAPKSILTCALIPPFMSKIFPKKDVNGENLDKKKNVSFTGKNILAKGVGKIIDSSFVQKLTDKFHNTNFPMHLMAMTDALATGVFIRQTQKSKGIEEDRKRALIYNSAISTGLCIGGGYALDKVSKKSSEKFIEKFKIANAQSKNLDKYVEGIKIVKPALILGGIYYIIIPFISTFLADRFDDKNKSVVK